MINLFHKILNQPFKFKTKSGLIDVDIRASCNRSSLFKFSTTMLKSNLCDYSNE